jgi:diaminopimelate decarboxylase
MNIPYSPKSIHFALMANSTPQFIRLVKEAGLKVFVNSLLHLEIVRKLGFKGKEIVYAASAMDTKTMKRVRSCNAVVIMDSMGQFERWRALFPEVGVGIRCNIGTLVEPKKTLAGYFIGKKSRLGFTIDAIEQLKGNSAVKGLHIYVGTNILDIDYFLNCYSHITRLAILFPELEFLDFGGGFGLGENSSHKIDMNIYGQKVTELMDQLSDKLGRRIKLMLEPGRIIGGDAGYFVCKVVDIKMQGDHQLIGVNASCVQFPRPLFYPDSAYHPTSILAGNGSQKGSNKLTSSIFGCSTYSRDFLARNISLPETAIGDLVVLGYAGSYCSSAHTKFLGFPEAEEFFL